MGARGWTAVALALLLGGGCSLATVGLATDEAPVDDSGIPFADGATSEVPDDVIVSDTSPLFMPDDSDPIPECTGKANGTACGAPSPPRVCVEGECQPGRCGDGFVDPRGEDCDDGNIKDGDNCPADCKAKCKSDPECDDFNECTTDGCDLARHVCKPHLAVPLKTPCTAGQCNGTKCTAGTCGDGTRLGTEECDDGNTIDTDACQSDCTWTCETDDECDDKNACNGRETCDVSKHLCKPGTAITCTPEACSTARCIAPGGACVSTVVDNDGDRYSPSSFGGTCGLDCHDGLARVNPEQTTFFQASYPKASGGAPSWDYNCDGKQELEHPNKGACVKSGSDCTHTWGWESTVPGCGQTGSAISGCEGGSCRPLITSFVQKCR